MTDLISRLTQALAGPEHDRRTAVDELWATLPADDHAARCIVAHYAADLQPTLTDEVQWDEVSLAESALLTDESLRAIQPSLTVEGFLPSLHLNVADGYRRQERFAEAIAQLDAGRSHLHVFDDAPAEQGAYVAVIRDGYTRVARLIAERSTAPSAPSAD
ncbi:hypothetical protein [Gordonia phthalatica]|uniref:Uncharacterized protein n=1 Tax=Gordonia phthalatica TaxID=1136941 RepID=A0A0N9N4T7_9ACTN|nr:hypothetical protein [Gordonia phthalatica]ALG85457.1 hypothetical protein ACH46_14460 [Gordonia phthalatica]